MVLLSVVDNHRHANPVAMALIQSEETSQLVEVLDQ
jgi:hypothetical protein